MTEFRPNDLRFKQWRPLTDRELKSIVVEEMKEGGESWMTDIRTYVESAHIKDYNPDAAAQSPVCLGRCCQRQKAQAYG